jgi:SAM-dependent methyltransferase
MLSAAAYHAGKFLKDSELLPEVPFCVWCRFGGLRKRELVLQRNPDVWLLKCPRCRAVSTSRVATQATLDAYYGSYYEASDRHHVTCGNPGRHARHICRYAETDSSATHISILDFGGGDGSISHAVGVELAKKSEASIEITVVDYDSRLVAPKLSRIEMSREGSLDKIPVDQRFDIVLASAILEHLTDPANVARRLLDSVAPRGYFYARTPYMVPILRVLSRVGLPLDFTFPAHFHDLGEDFWNNALSTLGLDSQEWLLVRSRPSIVETSLADDAIRTILAYIMKAPWWVLRNHYGFPGGWEIFLHRL